MSVDYENIDDDSEYEMEDSSHDGSLENDSSIGGHQHMPFHQATPENKQGIYQNDIASPIDVAGAPVVMTSPVLPKLDSMSLQEDEDYQEDGDYQENEEEEYEYEYSEEDYEYDDISSVPQEQQNDSQNYHQVSGGKRQPSSMMVDTATTSVAAANPNEPPSKSRCTRLRKHPESSSFGEDRISPSAVTTWEGTPHKNNKTISITELLPIMEQRIADIVEALGIPAAAAVALLCDKQWNRQTVLEAFMLDPDQTLRKAGVVHRCLNTRMAKVASGVGDDADCPICMETTTSEDSLSLPCGHSFCCKCWHDYLDNTISMEGATCMSATCPDAACQERLSEEEVQIAAPELLEKYKEFRLRSFAGAFGRWCPGPGCNRVVDKSASAMLLGSRDADCNHCGTMFCVECHEEPHAPVSCDFLQKWKVKDTDESSTVQWMTANTKHCPKCQSRIEKNGGCQYVTCRKCSHGFCWVCMGSHHVWQCNAYKQNDEVEDERLRVKNELERYIHYYTRFQGHNIAQKFALGQLKPGATVKEDSTTANREEAAVTDKPDRSPGSANGASAELDLPDYLKEANRQLVECRRVLKYTYVFAFFHFADRGLKKTQECFESHQGLLEGLTEGLSMATEKSLMEIDRQDVVNRTRVIGTFIKNILSYVDEITGIH
jgi:ariadne-1